MHFTHSLVLRLQQNSATQPLSRTIQVVKSLPISQRKEVIAACQIREIQPKLRSVLVIPHLKDFRTLAPISKTSFLLDLEEVLTDNIQTSILWIIARSCLEPLDNDEHQEVAQAGFDKEIAASQTFHTFDQNISYSALFRSKPGHSDPGQWWIDQCHRSRSEFHRRLHLRTFYPSVSRVKNVSDETTSIFHSFTGIDYVRTVDLEVFYARTGHHIGGACEVRSAWKFNDLKPRMYYCTGGRDYWASRYMKGVAVALMESIPSTYAKIRTSPALYLSNVARDDYVTTWDFESFTTKLSELKHFLWYVARASECDQTKVELFDYRDGFHTVDLYRLLDDYNETCNMFSPFGIHRMVGEFVEKFEVDLQQFNSGMLGVPGNIGFSTALHGLIATKASGPGKAVCVGDDALAIDKTGPTRHNTRELKHAGLLHPTKFGIILPSVKDEDRSAMTFLKRRLEVINGILTLSVLFDFPLPPFIDGETGFRTKPPDFSLRDRVFKVATQAGSLLWDLNINKHQVDNVDSIHTVFVFLRTAYRYLRIPLSGKLPGQSLYAGTPDEFTVSGFVIPDISSDFDPTREDWLLVQLDGTYQQFYLSSLSLPVTGVETYSLRKGEELVTTQSTWLSCMEDLGFVSLQPVMEWRSLGTSSSYREILKLIGRVFDDTTDKAVSVVCLRDVPPQYCKTMRDDSSMYENHESEI